MAKKIHLGLLGLTFIGCVLNPAFCEEAKDSTDYVPYNPSYPIGGYNAALNRYFYEGNDPFISILTSAIQTDEKFKQIEENFVTSRNLTYFLAADASIDYPREDFSKLVTLFTSNDGKTVIPRKLQALGKKYWELNLSLNNKKGEDLKEVKAEQKTILDEAKVLYAEASAKIKDKNNETALKSLANNVNTLAEKNAEAHGLAQGAHGLYPGGMGVGYAGGYMYGYPGQYYGAPYIPDTTPEEYQRMLNQYRLLIESQKRFLRETQEQMSKNK